MTNRHLAAVPDKQEGLFLAVVTRDAQALARHGQPYFASRLIREDAETSIFEIQFADGDWMLVDLRDLDI